MIGKTILHYKIVQKLGQGGMGVLYLAEDVKLDRKVAIKFLPTTVAADDEQRERFKREAKAAAALNHANIATIYTIEEFEQQIFIVMEYVDGQELKSLISQSQLPVEQVIDISRQIADGLHAAHSKDIIHRDIKSANIMLTGEGQVKILDFGLAKIPGSNEITQAGSILGTLAYMSPEQIQSAEVDQRADIWAMGVVMFEMLTGELPFRDEYAQALMYSILSEPVPSLTDYRDDVPENLASAISKCLEKSPEDRYASTRDLVAELDCTTEKTISPTPEIDAEIPVLAGQSPKPKRHIIFAAALLGVIFFAIFIIVFWLKPTPRDPIQRKMLAVMPFENYGSPENDYFAAGITNAITTRLASIAGIGVISRQSANKYRDSGKTTRQIGEELGVDFILDGTVQREATGESVERVRITPHLIRVSDETLIWTETFDEQMAEVFQLQTDISENVAKALDITLLAPERQAIARQATDNLEAYDFYLRGNDFAARDALLSEAQNAVEMFEKAIAADPDFAVAIAALAKEQMWLAWNFGKTEYIEQAKQSVEKAAKMAPDLAETHLAQGFYYYWGSRDYKKALREFETVQKRYPNNVEAIAATGYIYRRQGEWENAVKQLESAATLNPRNYDIMFDLGNTLNLMRRYNDAERYLNRAIALEPDIDKAYSGKVELCVSRDGNTQMARLVVEQAAEFVAPVKLVNLWTYLEKIDGNYQTALQHLSIQYDSLFYYLDKAETYSLMKQPAMAIANYDTAKTRFAFYAEQFPESAVFQAGLGLAFAGLGEKAAAIQAGDKAVALLPIETDAITGALILEILAWINVKTGNFVMATRLISILLENPSRLSVNKLLIEPSWKPLHNNQQFKTLLSKYVTNIP